MTFPLTCLAALAVLVSLTCAQEENELVCFKGIAMDTYCIELGLVKRVVVVPLTLVVRLFQILAPLNCLPHKVSFCMRKVVQKE